MKTPEAAKKLRALRKVQAYYGGGTVGELIDDLKQFDTPEGRKIRFAGQARNGYNYELSLVFQAGIFVPENDNHPRVGELCLRLML